MAGASDVDPAQAADDVGSGRSVAGAAAAFQRSVRTFRTASRNPDIARAVGAYGVYAFGEWATWIAMLVYAFDRGGATASGIVALVQLLPSAVLGPLLSGLAERWPRERVLLTALAAQAGLMAIAALALYADASVPVVYFLAAAMTLFMTIGKPAHHSLLPWLARSPEELTVANVATGTIQNVAILLAPVVAGLLLAAAGPAAVFTMTAIALGIGVALVAPIRTERSRLARKRTGDRVGDEIGLDEGIRILRKHAGSRTIVLLIATGSVIEGAMDVISVVLALEVLQVGDAGVGILGSSIGAGGLIGAAVAAGLVGRARLGLPFRAGLLLWSLPVVVVGIAPSLGLAVLAFLVAGIGRSVMDVAGRTLLQRVAPDAAMNAIFGALEGLHDLMLAIGSIVVPALILLVGPRWALVLTGLWLPVVLVVSARAVRRADDHGVVHVRELRLLRALPMFASLAPPTIERLAAHLDRQEAGAGPIIREGETGDRFYVIDEGRAAVSVGGRAVRELSAGDGFGEIALLKNVPRTATVTAVTPVSLYGLERDVFLTALGAESVSRSIAEQLVAERLASDRAGEPVIREDPAAVPVMAERAAADDGG
jgi:Major Facilitator Superfamily/Cyclic nucleotide-binding domain